MERSALPQKDAIRKKRDKTTTKKGRLRQRQRPTPVPRRPSLPRPAVSRTPLLLALVFVLVWHFVYGGQGQRYGMEAALEVCSGGSRGSGSSLGGLAFALLNQCAMMMSGCRSCPVQECYHHSLLQQLRLMGYSLHSRLTAYSAH